MPSQQEWHERYEQQARWTSSVRRFLFQQVSVSDIQPILEVGCGSGVILAELMKYYGDAVFGIDIDLRVLQFAHQQNKNYRIGRANGLHLPFSKAIFSITCCHFYLLWVEDPLLAVREMVRVTRPGGRVLVMAEPDYGGRIDYPEEMAKLGRLQTEALWEQGANPTIGRKIKVILHQAGLKNIQAGVLGGQWREAPDPGFLASEWKMFETDLGEHIKPEDLSRLKALDADAWQNGARILYVPTFYAMGQV